MLQAWDHRTDGKLYRLNTPQTPIARTARYGEYCMDEFPSGTNAVVAVLAYTGYDMEDAMILNESSMERGFAHATLHKCETINLKVRLSPTAHPARLAYVGNKHVGNLKRYPNNFTNFTPMRSSYDKSLSLSICRKRRAARWCLG